MRKPESRTVRQLHRRITRWYIANQRILLWRTTSDPYAILVSEIMLQQTQVDRVKQKLPIFLRKFPTWKKLASSTTADVVRAWQGMGYNNRAVRLRELAKIVMERYDGRLPSNVDELETLPGIGPYTAHAVACFAYKQHVPLVDVNIQRVLSRIFWRTKHPGSYRPSKKIWNLAESILPKNSYVWNQALMDLGATICTARRPSCELCPVQTICHSKHLMHTTASFLNKKKSEPSYDGIPRRIWRGKIVDLLRNVNGKSYLTIEQLQQRLLLYNSDGKKWLDTLIGVLIRDRIITTRTTASHIKVMLARS